MLTREMGALDAGEMFGLGQEGPEVRIRFVDGGKPVVGLDVTAELLRASNKRTVGSKRTDKNGEVVISPPWIDDYSGENFLLTLSASNVSPDAPGEFKSKPTLFSQQVTSVYAPSAPIVVDLKDKVRYLTLPEVKPGETDTSPPGGIPTWALVLGAAAITGVAVYLLTKKT